MKQKLLNSMKLRATLLVAILCSLFTGTAWATDVVDQLTKADLLATGTSYTTFSNVQKNTAVYAGRTSVQNSSIGMKRDTSNGAGIFTTVSGGVAKSLSFTWTSTSSRTLQVWGKNSAYTLNDTKNQTNFGTLITSIAYDSGNTNPTLTLNSESEYEYILIIPSSTSMLSITDIKITWEVSTGGGEKTATSTAVNAPVGFVTDLNGNTGVSAGTLTATVTPEGASALASPAITWSSTNTSVATVNASTGAVTLWAVGSANIKAKYDGDETYEGSQGTYALTVTNSNPGDGTLAKPYTVAEALALISGYSSNSGSASSVYTKGIVSSVASLYNSTMLVYNISIDGTGSNTLQVFRGKNVGNTNFSATTDLEAGDEVIIYGQLYKYGSTPEINTGNYLYSLNGKIKPTITFGAASYEVAYNGSLTISATSEPSGTITYSSSDTDIAEINATTGVVTPKTQGEVTIRATLAEGAGNVEWYEEVTLTVTDGRVSAGIEFAQTSITRTWGESYTGQAVTNPNGLTVSYSSTDPAVATVNASTGEVTIVKAGTTTIKATFAGNSSYMPAEVSYTLTVNKAAAGLSFDETAFDIDLNDDSFVAPTLNNPNSLTVTWASDDTDIATVNASTGALTLTTTAEGEVTITASSEATDNYNAGNASYTITITDPNKKGTKRNPYTVAEVIDMNPTSTSAAEKTDVYVLGYIAGCVNTSTGAIVTTYVNSNLALVDEYDDTSDNISVQLANNTSHRTNFNLVDHPEYARVAKVLIKADVYKYCGVAGLKNIDEMTKVAEAVTVTNAGYATWASDTPLDFTGKDIDAYIATTKGNGTGVNFTQINKVPANTGVLLHYTGGKTEEIPVFDGTGAESTTGNKFVKGTGAAVATDGSTVWNYILNNIGGNIGFYKSAGQTVAKNRAYLSILKSESAAVKGFISIDFDAIVDGISATRMNNEEMNNEQFIFNLAGQRLSKLQKGINIVNGKKVLVK